MTGPMNASRRGAAPAWALVLLLALLALAPIAHATPPDPSWVPGLYDDADLDDVVSAVTAETAAVESGGRPVGALVLSAPERLAPRPAGVVPAARSRVPEGRAPPA